MKSISILQKASILTLVATSLTLIATAAVAQQITVGVIASATGPAAAAGIPVRNVFASLPNTVAGVPVKYVILDDATDPTQSVKNFRKLTGEEKADIIVGSNFTPGCTALRDVAVETQTAMLCLAPLVIPEAVRPWVFAPVQTVDLMLGGVVEHMKVSGVKTAAFIGYADAWGDLALRTFEDLTARAEIKIVAKERYNRTDTSVTGQVLKIVGTNPDAVFIGASYTPSALPHITLAERGYRKPIYHTHGAAGQDFLRVGGKAIEGAILPTGPFLVIEQLPDTNPIKKKTLEFFSNFEKANPDIRTQSYYGYAYDAFLIIEGAVKAATAKAKPGTPEFRRALRDEIEGSSEIVGTQGVYKMTASDHSGTDTRARVLVRAEGGKFKLIP